MGASWGCAWYPFRYAVRTDTDLGLDNLTHLIHGAAVLQRRPWPIIGQGLCLAANEQAMVKYRVLTTPINEGFAMTHQIFPKSRWSIVVVLSLWWFVGVSAATTWAMPVNLGKYTRIWHGSRYNTTIEFKAHGRCIYTEAGQVILADFIQEGDIVQITGPGLVPLTLQVIDRSYLKKTGDDRDIWMMDAPLTAKQIAARRLMEKMKDPAERKAAAARLMAANEGVHSLMSACSRGDLTTVKRLVQANKGLEPVSK